MTMPKTYQIPECEVIRLAPAGALLQVGSPLQIHALLSGVGYEDLFGGGLGSSNTIEHIGYEDLP